MGRHNTRGREVVGGLGKHLHPAYRVRVTVDHDWIEDGSDGKPLPESEEHYRGNEYRDKDGSSMSYARYLTTYGDPDNYTGYAVDLEQQCACCGEWKAIEGMSTSLYDEYQEEGTYELDDVNLNEYIRELAKDMVPRP